ncbi:MAG TPA: flagellar basal body P-ring protein FlgI, partial [Sedimentisphaerales bacterium]|nr:flagellar basal body P-ring protein FlgI [Sedimentisphaerales bacterium]
MISWRRKMLVLGLLQVVLAGCGGPSTPGRPAGSGVSAEEGVQIRDLVVVPELLPSPLEGFGIVAGLGESGSSECPLDVLEYLKRHVRVMMPNVREDPERFIRSLDTAVVRVVGQVEPGTARGGRFDVMVLPVPGTQTRSFVGGQLFTTDLMAPGRVLAGGQTMATAAGPIFIDTLSESPDPLTGWVLAGGTAEADYPLFLRLREPDFRMASAIRNRIIQRFGPGTAVAASEAVVTLRPPQNFRASNTQFVALAEALYVFEDDETNARRAAILVARLAKGRDMERTEASLIGLGRLCAPKVRTLLDSDNVEVRLRAARILLTYGEPDGLSVLRDMLHDSTCRLRMEALRAIADWAPTSQVCGILSRLLDDADMDIRLAAVDELLKCGSPLVTRENVGGRLFLDLVGGAARPAIYVARTGAPRIILFNRNMIAEGPIFMTTADGSLTLNAATGADAITLIRSRRGETG